MQRAIVLIEAAELLAKKYDGDCLMDFAIGTLLREASSLLLCQSNQRISNSNRATPPAPAGAANDTDAPPISDLIC